MSTKNDSGGDSNDDEDSNKALPAKSNPFFFDINAVRLENYTSTNKDSQTVDNRPSVWRNKNSDKGEASNLHFKTPNYRGSWRTQNRETRNACQFNKSKFGNDMPKNQSDFGNFERGENKKFNKTEVILKVKPYKLNLDKLENLKEPGDIVLEFVKGKDALKEMLAGSLDQNTIVQLIKIFSKVCQAKLLTNLNELFLIIIDKHFMNKLEEYVIRMPLQVDRNENQSFWNDIEGFFNDVNTLCQKAFEITPHTAADYVPSLIKAVQLTLSNLGLETGIVDKIKRSFGEVYGLLESHLEKTEKKKRAVNYVEEEPPDNFHYIDIYPSAYELTTPGRTFLRRNKVEGAYKDVWDYLDVQFRLLREDFVGPVRAGICEYLEQLQDQTKKRGPSSIKVYKKVCVIKTEVSQNQLGFVIQFDEPNKKSNFANSKHFMFGSLLCFTTNNFESIIFGKVISRDEKYMKLNQIVVGFENGIQLVNNATYTMAECKVYFEPYYHVLKALQNVNALDFPLSRYLVDVDMSGGVDPPVYAYEFNIGGFEDQLNPSQLEAYTTALSSEISIIQGPPGTGKTFLGLKVAHTLLQNYSHWGYHGPMLVICFTNHALDQFLEGILNETTSIVRIGGQCKHAELKEMNIRELRRNTIRYIMPRRKKISRKQWAYDDGGYEYYDENNDVYYTDIYENCNDKYNIGERNLRLLKLRESNVKNCGKYLQIQNKILSAIDSYESVLGFSHFKSVVHNFKLFEGSNEQNLNWLSEELRHMQNDTHGIHFTHDGGTSQVENEQSDDIGNHLNKVHMERFGLDIDDDDHLIGCNIDDYISKCVDLNELYIRKVELERHIRKSDVKSEDYATKINKYNLYRDQYNYFKGRLNWLKKSQNMLPKHVDMENPYNMTFDDRWLLYGSWLKTYRPYIIEKIFDLDENYRLTCETYNECKDEVDMKIMKGNKVIGMTTTGAARMQSTLQKLQCPIVIVEEAAEVLESHIVSALSSTCQQLILIGDHKQLKPATADYQVEVQYKLGVSLFERMVNNNFPCNTLEVQHRMRPEISRLITPAIYEKLEDHVSVKGNIKIPGVTVPVYFINHENAETATNDSSKENYHEAIYIIKLARYLVLNNVEPETITIIAAYAGQLFLLLRERKLYDELTLVKIVVLDNYQGEENNIILLSLVRNNKEGSIGFLSLENRVCVALSRARHAMYIMGNMNLLCERSKIWPKIRKRLEETDAIGNALTLRCELHQALTKIEAIEDFEKVSDGGCMNICEQLLDCGHYCDQLCHLSPHTRCYQPCKKILCEFNHQCPKKCNESCHLCMVPKRVKLPCEHEQDAACYENEIDIICNTRISVILPCGHEALKPCSQNIEDVICRVPCEANIEPCGHKCTLICHINRDPKHIKYRCPERIEKQFKGCSNTDAPHKRIQICYVESKYCNITVRKQRTKCSHRYDVACSVDVDTLKCEKPCNKKLYCGHVCKMSCNESCSCNVLVKKVIKECGHTIHIDCSENPIRDKCEYNCKLTFPCGHACVKKCKEKCGDCKILVPKVIKECGHSINIECSLDPIRDKCKEKCKLTLPCGHPCEKKCKEKCGDCKILVPKVIDECGHSINIECSIDPIRDKCKEKCKLTLPCGHACEKKCKRKCGDCKILLPKVIDDCGHTINIECSIDPTRDKCNEKCKLTLPCGHACEKKCKEKCGGCKILVPKVINGCGHTINIECSINPIQDKCKEKCTQTLPCGHACQMNCNAKCNLTKCNELVGLAVSSPCGHNIKVPCNKSNEITNDIQALYHCSERCTEILECKLQCKGTCGQCAQGRMHKSCDLACMRKLLCSHHCTLACKSICKPCQLKCSYTCPHGTCENKCGEPCTQCNEQCSRTCEHQSCDKNCYEICSVPPCMEPCKHVLKCNHPCIGYCGEPCPQLCRICHKEELNEIYFGNEEQENARFVYLEECKHIFEGTELEKRFKVQTVSGPIGMLECPKCKISITQTHRFSDYIKICYQDMDIASEKYLKAEVINKDEQIMFKGRLSQLYRNFIRKMSSQSVKTIFRNFNVTFSSTSYSQALNYPYKYIYFEKICNLYIEQNLCTPEVVVKARNYMEGLFRWMTLQATCITKQQINDYKKELRRTNRVMQFCKIMDVASNSNEVCEKILFSCLPYSEADDAIVKSELENLVVKTGIEFIEVKPERMKEMLELSKGHWFKCVAGHIYYIGESSTETIKCTECILMEE